MRAILRAFSIGLVVFAIVHAMYFVTKFSMHVSEVADLFFYLSPVVGSYVIAVLAPQYKFRMGVFLSIPASLIMGIFRSIAIDLSIISSTDYKGIDGTFFVAMMNFPFVLILCALGAALGCIFSYAASRRNATRKRAE